MKRGSRRLSSMVMVCRIKLKGGIIWDCDA